MRKVKGRIKKIENKVILFVHNNSELKELHGENVTIKINGTNEYIFGKVIKYANRYVISIPKTEPYEEYIKKGNEISFEIIY